MTKFDHNGERYARDAEVMAIVIEVMSERGYAGTSMQEIAARLGILKGSLYHYFSSKEELLMRILNESHEQVLAIDQRISEQGLSPLEELLEYLRESSVWYLANVERANIFFSDRRHLTGERLERANQLGRAFEIHIQNLIQKGQEQGQIRGDQDVRLISRFVMGTVNNVRFWPNRSSPGPDAVQMSETLVALTRSAISASPSTP